MPETRRRTILTPAVAAARSRVGSTHYVANRRPEDAAARQAVNDARRDYAAAALEEYIRKIVDAAPPLTPEQRDRLAAILRSTGTAA